MQIYLPVAESSANVFLLLGMADGVGFLMTPLLIFVGVPPPVAVATAANQIVAASVAGALAHWRRGNVDSPTDGRAPGGRQHLHPGAIAAVTDLSWNGRMALTGARPRRKRPAFEPPDRGRRNKPSRARNA